MTNLETNGVENNFDNVYIYIADALRMDYFSPSLRDDHGFTKTISSGTFSPPGFATLVTGRYPHEHGVYGFHHELDSEMETMFTAFPTVNTGFYRGIGQIGEMLGEEHNVPSEPFELDEPFLIMERDLLTHVPYAKDQQTTIPEGTESYWKEVRTDRSKLVDDYERSARLSAERFESRVAELEEKEILEDTLVILTADHGETLGENGLVGHRHSITPEISYVPTMIYNEGASIQQDLIGHTDIFPIVADALGRSDQVPKYVRTREISEPISQTVYLTESADMDSEGVWGPKGGYVFVNEGLVSRLKWMVVKMAISGARYYHRRRPLSVVNHGLEGLLSQPLEYGSPQFSEEAAKKVVESALEDRIEGENTELSSEAKDRLRELGYIEEANK